MVSTHTQSSGEYLLEMTGINKSFPQGEIVNILLKIKNSFLPTKQILIGL